jgi:predicted lipoprotein with Yx(FWY)xxD motif
MSWLKRIQARLLAPLAIMAAVGVGAAALALADSHPTGAVAAGAKKVQLRSGPLGRYLVDGHGRSLYLFEKDRGGRSSCYGNCASVWPPLIANGRVAHGPGVSAGKLSSVARRGGGREVTYGGHPLYYYAGDARPGQTSGEGLNQFGAKWYVLAASGHKIDKD